MEIFNKGLFPDCQEYKIKFKGEEYLLIGPDKTSGAIATREQYENCEIGVAHLFPDGKIRRYGEVIGTSEEIEFLD